VDDFEMLDHPVTNAEWKVFTDATGHKPPLHWENGQIPEGMAGHPVIFVNRFDVAAYLKWRSGKEKRIYRLPTASEFEYAERGGAAGAKYPWGEASAEGKANYDADGSRTFGQWRKFLKPVKSYAPNPLKLYDMAGNVWQMVESHADPALERFVYRVEDPTERETRLAGGSWARTEYYLRCGVFGGAGAGIRHPDIGFRPVREPAGSTHFRREPRRVIAAPAGHNQVYVGWQQLPTDLDVQGYYVYRSARRDAAGERITAQPVASSTNFVDAQPPQAGRVYYRVRAVARDGKEGPPSEWAGVSPAGARSGLIAVFEPTAKEGGFVPVFGDLNGDGVFEAVLRLDNGIHEMSRDPGVPVELEAFTSFGTSIWRRPLVKHDQCFGSSSNVPVVVYDLDGDGKAEVICRLQEGDTVYLAVLNGMNGRVIRKTPWTAMVSDFAKSSTRIHLAVACLDGKHPALITQTGLYENEVFDAYDANLKKLWQFRSFGETNGSGSHHIDVADADGDGRDEVFDGTTVLNPDGTLRWSIYREHPDIVAVKHILGDPRSRQVYYAVESNVHAGAYVVDAKTGKIIWKLNREDDPRWTHAHIGWASKIWDGEPGMQMLTNRDGHDAKDTVLFASDGKILMNPFPGGWRPANWTGGAVRELMRSGGREFGRFTGRAVEPIPNLSGADLPGLGCGMSADLAGDYRDEIVCEGKTAAGNPAVFVFTNLAPNGRREITRTANREYRLWLARNRGGGYASYFEWEP
jgi:rhamnogalacturonan endolyase